jgi:hypothetical protein
VLDVGGIVDVVGGSVGAADVGGGANVVEVVEVDVVAVVDVGGMGVVVDVVDVGGVGVVVDVVAVTVCVDDVVVVTAKVGGVVMVVEVCAGSGSQVVGSEGWNPVGETRVPATSIQSASMSLLTAHRRPSRLAATSDQ